jgi:hypothetical protein
VLRAVVPIAVLIVLGTTAPADARQRSFHTPSGNIACLYRSGGPFLRCDVHSLDDTAFTLDRRHRGKRVHVTDAVPAGRVLRYGATARLGPFRCRSRRTGLTCRSKPSKHGFKLARERQYTF